MKKPIWPIFWQHGSADEPLVILWRLLAWNFLGGNQRWSQGGGGPDPTLFQNFLVFFLFKKLDYIYYYAPHIPQSKRAYRPVVATPSATSEFFCAFLFFFRPKGVHHLTWKIRGSFFFLFFPHSKQERAVSISHPTWLPPPTLACFPITGFGQRFCLARRRRAVFHSKVWHTDAPHLEASTRACLARRHWAVFQLRTSGVPSSSELGIWFICLELCMLELGTSLLDLYIFMCSPHCWKLGLGTSLLDLAFRFRFI